MFNHNILKTNQMLKKWYPNTLAVAIFVKLELKPNYI